MITKEANTQGFIESGSDLETIDAAKADVLSDHASILWGTNARTRSSNAQKNLEWKPSAGSLESTIANIVRMEAKELTGKKPSIRKLSFLANNPFFRIEE